MTFIIIKKESSRFKPHYNRQFCDKAHPEGQWVHTKQDYVQAMKDRGLEPYRPESVKPYKPKKYAPSKELREIATYVDNHKDKHGKVELPPKIVDFIRDSSGYKKGKKVPLMKKGGFDASN